jgi:transposase
MTPREERGVLIAATCRLHRNDDGTWKVPSQTSKEAIFYTVDLATKACTCPDCKENGMVCKHYFAASIVHKRDTLPDGSMIETRMMLFEERKTYKQSCSAYNLAQRTEKRRLQVLLADLCRHLPEKDCSKKRGPKPHLVRDSIFSMTFKVYCGLSSRRFSTDLLEAFEKGFITRPIPGPKVPIFFENPEFTPILQGLIAQSARPLKAVERNFAIDSSGFGSTRHERWYDQKYGVTRNRSVWVKAHIATGVKTNVVTAVRILEQHSPDCPQFAPLVKETREGFEIDEVSADKAYVSVENFELVAQCGGQAFIAFKDNTTGGAGGMLEKAYHYFQFNQEDYVARYHKRSNAESTFSAVKRKFGDSVMSRNDAAMANEVLCKFLCHNLTCLIQEQETLGIAPVFWPEEKPERAMIFPLHSEPSLVTKESSLPALA